MFTGAASGGLHSRTKTEEDCWSQNIILALTSYATQRPPWDNRVWVLDNILGTPPPAPPPGVPALKDRGDDGRILSVRQSMEEHRANPVCASCHARMDPIGFALENFDGIGRWRTGEGSANTPIDTSGVLPDGSKFRGPVELRKILDSKPEEFATIVTEKLLTHALGRGVEYYDEAAVKKIVHDGAPSDYRWVIFLLLGIVNGEIHFKYRRSLQAVLIFQECLYFLAVHSCVAWVRLYLAVS